MSSSSIGSGAASASGSSGAGDAAAAAAISKEPRLRSSSSPSPERLMVGGEDSSYLRPIPEDDEDDKSSSVSPTQAPHKLTNHNNPHVPTSASLSLLDSANPFILPMGWSGTATATKGNGGAAAASSGTSYLVPPGGPLHRRHDAASDDARSSTKGIIVDPRSRGDDDDDDDDGKGRNLSNDSVVGTDRAEVAYANDGTGNNATTTSAAAAAATGYHRAAGRGGVQAPEQQRNHPPVHPPRGFRSSLTRRHSQVSERWKGLSKRNQGILVGSIVLTILVVVAIVLVIVFTTTDSGGGGGGRGGTSPSQAPSSLGSLSPSTAAYLDEVLYNVSSPAAFDDPSSPQSQARNWLHSDLLLNDAVDDGQERVVQRYVCVELVYALSIPPSVLQSDKVECDWAGFSCDQEYRGHVVTNISFPSRNLRGTLPDEVAQLPYLQRIELYNNSLTGPIPEAWTSNSTPMQNLYRIDLSKNNLTGSLPANFWTAFPPLSYVYLNDNQLTGKLVEPALSSSSSSSSTLDLMEEVWLQRNQLTGTLPAQWMLTRFPNLEKLKLGSNRFTGTIPTPVLVSGSTSLGDNEVAWPANLTHYDVSANDLHGTIPASLFYSFAKLQSLYVHTNSFTGTLPSSSSDPGGTLVAPASSSSLERVLMHSNLLNGSIPTDLGSTWTSLSVLTLHNNSLTGAIAPALQCSSWPNLTEVWADCPYQVDCSCPECNCSSYAR